MKHHHMKHHHMDHHSGHKGHESGHHMYENEVDKPHVPKHGHQEPGMGCHDFKGEAMNIAYGQAGEEGCRSDYKKVSSQEKHYHWEGPSEY